MCRESNHRLPGSTVNNSSVRPKQLEQLFQNLEDCQITAAEHAQLMDLLRTNAEVRSAYIDHMEFVGLLHARAEAHAELEGLNSIIQEVPSSRLFVRSLIVAVALLLLAAVGATLFRGPSYPKAEVTAGPNASWNFSAGGLDEAIGFLPGSMISLDLGTLEIQLGSGNEVILEGPAQLRIVNPELVDLSGGRLWARANGKKLTVRTEHLKIIDLGTEFGVFASDALGEEVHVRQGRVMVEPKHPSLDSITLASGEAVRSNAIGKLRRIPFTTVGFLTDLPSVVPYQHWSFDEEEENEFPSSGYGMEPSSMNVYSLDDSSEIPRDLVDGRFGGAINLNQDASFARSGFAGIEGDVARTVSLWVKASPQASDSMTDPTLVAWGLPTEFGTKWRLTISNRGQGMGTVWGGAWSGGRAKDGISILDGKWHHLVYVFTGHHSSEGVPELRHYLDGEPLMERRIETEVPVNTECSAKHSRPLTLGCQIISKPSRDTFKGSIDELYVFRGVLNDEQIQSLYRYNSLEGHHRKIDSEYSK
jgi:hypothetical protein